MRSSVTSIVRLNDVDCTETIDRLTMLQMWWLSPSLFASNNVPKLVRRLYTSTVILFLEILAPINIFYSYTFTIATSSFLSLTPACHFSFLSPTLRRTSLSRSLKHLKALLIVMSLIHHTLQISKFL